MITTARCPFPTGARLIAGETALVEGETHAARFDMYVETDEEGADAFERTPCLLFTLQGGDTGLRASCAEASAAGFALSLLPDGATAKGGRVGAGATHSSAAAADPSTSGGSITPAPAEAEQEQTDAAVKLQARVRGRRVRRQLGAPAARSAVVAWVAVDAEGGEGMPSRPPALLACKCSPRRHLFPTGDGMLSGTIQAAIGASRDLSFEVDYPEAPLLLYAAIGGGEVGQLARPRCAKLDPRGASLAIDEANAAAATASRDAGAAGAPEVTLAWLALPQGKLFALADGTDDEVEASHLEQAQELELGIGDEGDAAGQRDVPP